LKFAERNVVIKNHQKVRLRFALAYPSPYQVGMSNLGFRLIYELINNRDDALCERFFFQDYGQPPKSLESGMSLGEFDAVGFSFQHEMDYLRALDMIASSGIPLHSSERTRPVIIAGGPSVSANPLPLSPFIDFFMIGEVEPIMDLLLEALSQGGAKEALGSIPGMYRYGSEAERVFVKDLNGAYHAVRQVRSASEDWFSSSFLLEVSRGCSRGCRFCMECYLFQPRRERSLERIEAILDEARVQSTMERVTCISSAFFDHSQLLQILGMLRSRRLHFSLPSVRVSDVKEGLFELIAAGGQRTLTIAPETPSERLRAAINKRLDEDQLLKTLADARDAGISSLKMYFLIGLPGEGISDIEGLKPLLAKIISAGFGPGSIHISLNPMIPKSGTPFQWTGLIGQKEFRERSILFRRICSELGIRRVEEMDYRWGVIQAYLSTSGIEAAEKLEMMANDLRAGGKGDLGSWRRVLRAMGTSFDALYQPRPLDEPLPWEPIKGTVSKNILKREYKRATAYAK
jgi:radical SAM superfamily enzyme YgiQ (UPF0313 family)